MHSYRTVNKTSFVRINISSSSRPDFRIQPGPHGLRALTVIVQKSFSLSDT